MDIKMRNGSESVNSNDFLTLEDLSPEGKTILIRADINTPVDPKTGALIERMRIEEAAITLRDLGKSKLVLMDQTGGKGGGATAERVKVTITVRCCPPEVIITINF